MQHTLEYKNFALDITKKTLAFMVQTNTMFSIACHPKSLQSDYFPPEMASLIKNNQYIVFKLDGASMENFDLTKKELAIKLKVNKNLETIFYIDYAGIYQIAIDTLLYHINNSVQEFVPNINNNYITKIEKISEQMDIDGYTHSKILFESNENN